MRTMRLGILAAVVAATLCTGGSAQAGLFRRAARASYYYPTYAYNYPTYNAGSVGPNNQGVHAARSFVPLNSRPARRVFWRRAAGSYVAYPTTVQTYTTWRR